MSHKKFDVLNTIESDLYTCTMCGFCKQVCPVFIDDNWDTSAPRGRMTLAYGLLSGQIEPDDSIINKLYQCTQCQDCLRRCPSNAACPDVVIAARNEMVRLNHTNSYQQQLVENVQKTGNIYADETIDLKPSQGDIPFFVGCQYLSRPNSVKKIIKLLNKMDITPQLFNETCCGFPLHVMGFETENQDQIEKLSKLLPDKHHEVLTICPSCLKHLKEYYECNTVHILQMILKQIDSLPITRPVNKIVTYHDPCDLSRGAGIIDEPRAILSHMGCEVREMEHSGNTSRCCGGGGGILTWDEELSLRMSIKRIEEARETGAEMLITACPTCEQNLKRGAKVEATQSNQTVMPVRHILDLLTRSTK